MASYQREELFYRKTNLIPTSLKMLVEPDPSQQTLSLLKAAEESELSELEYEGDDKRYPRNSFEAEVHCRISELTLAAERINDLRGHYSGVIAGYAQQASGEPESTALSSCKDLMVESDRLSDINKYYRNLLTFYSFKESNVCAGAVKLSSNNSLQYGESTSALVSALIEVIWRKPDIEEELRGDKISDIYHTKKSQGKVPI